MCRENVNFDAIIPQNNNNQTAKPSLLPPPQTNFILSFNIYNMYI